LIGITQEANQMLIDDREKPIVECPICGTTLDVRGDVRNCPLGHWTQRGARRSAESY